MRTEEWLKEIIGLKQYKIKKGDYVKITKEYGSNQPRMYHKGDIVKIIAVDELSYQVLFVYTSNPTSKEFIGDDECNLTFNTKFVKLSEDKARLYAL